MNDPICFSGCGQPCQGFSAYCDEHKPVLARTNEPTGRRQAKCPTCGELFTTVRTFDSHLKYRPEGGVMCRDPRTMFTKEHKRKLVLTTRGWAKNPELGGFNTFARKERGSGLRLDEARLEHAARHEVLVGGVSGRMPA